MAIGDPSLIPDDIFPPFNLDFFPIIPTAVVSYLVFIFTLQYFVRNNAPLKLNSILAVHNFALCIFSLWLSVSQAYEAYRMYSTNGFFSVYCGAFILNEDIRMGQLSIWFYLSKYYELLDTVFLVLRKKPLSVLHVFHHAMVIPVTWMAVHSEIYMGWITSFNNASVHVFMYFYFAVYALGYTPWWKKYLTTLQIIQFMLDISTSIPFIVIYMMGIPCRGELYAWIIANLAGFSLLYLFVMFYKKSYSKKAKNPKKAN